jgi:hypothetical protein
MAVGRANDDLKAMEGTLLRYSITLLVVVCAGFALAGCGQGIAPGGATSVVQSAASAPGGQPTAPVAVPTSAREPAATKQWVMPNLVGGNLQQAQDQIQKVTGNPVFLTTSHDLTGKKRNQVVDSHWKVCTQNVAAGGQFTDKSVIDFGTVKLEESC